MQKNEVQYIDYKNLPNFPSLFLDYVSGNEKALQFYNGNPFEKKDWNKILSERRSNKVDRDSLVEILTRQNSRWGNSESTRRQIERLKDSSTVAIVTGQQAGILGGPLYTIYKAMTAILLARRIDSEGIPCVPVFWMETNDHDFHEIQAIGILNQENVPVRITYNDPSVIDGTPVGNIQLSPAWDQFFSELEACARATEFTPDIFKLISDAYQTGRKIGDAFAGFMHGLFAPLGLIFFDPFDPGVSLLTKNLVLQIIEKGSQITERVSSVSETLVHQGYQAQVKAAEDSAHLFYNHQGSRVLLRRNKVWQYGEIVSSEEEMRSYAERFPERFSPTVLTRPLFQDYLFPTAGYVGGPSEITYWAQVKPLYELFGMSMPIVYPRASVTLLEPKIAELMTSHNIPLLHAFLDSDKLVREVIRRAAPDSGEATFNKMREDMINYCSQLSVMVSGIDATLKGAVDTMQEKTLFQVNKFHEKYEKALERKHGVAVEQLKRISANILPQEKLQERELNVCSFLFRHGVDLIPRIIEQISVDTSKHMVIML